MMNKLIHILFLSCKKATQLVEKKQAERLSCPENLQLKAHKMMCSACSRYEKQSAFIDQVLKKTHDNLVNTDRRDQLLRERIKDRLNKS